MELRGQKTGPDHMAEALEEAKCRGSGLHSKRKAKGSPAIGGNAVTFAHGVACLESVSSYQEAFPLTVSDKHTFGVPHGSLLTVCLIQSSWPQKQERKRERAGDKRGRG